MTEVPTVEFPEKLHFLLTESARYKVLYGGRGAGKTKNIARALILLSKAKKLRILCAREFQNSISESVYEELRNQAGALGCEHEFEFQRDRIVHSYTGSEFFFKGLRHNIESIKSLSEIDIVWVEEANPVSMSTWDKLGPTIRGRHESDPRGNLGPFGKGPEIWISFNPEFEDDETYKRFVLHPPSEYDSKGNRYAIVQKINWTDNPWFPDDLREEMIQLKNKDENKWLEIWEGHTKQVLDGAIYADEIRQTILDKRIGKVPYDPNRPVQTFWDLGRADKTAIWFIQTIGMEFNVINYYEDRLKKMPFYINKLQEMKYNYGIHYLPHDGAAETLSNVTPQRQLLNAGQKVRIVQRPAKKFLGINAVRSVFPLCNFDETNTADGLQCLKRYCYEVNEDTGTFGKEPDHDTPWSHGCFTGDTKILTREGPKCINSLPETGEVWTQFGWKIYNNPHITRKNAPLVEVQFTNGYTVKCTPDHMFLTENGWKSAESLERGLLIRSQSIMNFNFLKENYIRKIKQDILSVQKDCIELCGKMLLALYQMIVTFIIETKANLITICTILNAFLRLNTYPTLLYVNGRTEDLFGFQKKQESLQVNGTNQKKVEFGIKNMLKQVGQNQLKIVYNVIWNLNVYLNKNIVLLNVPNYITQKKDQLKVLKNQFGKLTKIAKNVIKPLFMKDQGAVKIKNFVLPNVGKLIIKNVIKIGETADVWCLTVPNVGHFALENGAIVKNCDAFQTFALSLKTEQASKKPPKTVPASYRPGAVRHNGWMG